MIKSRAKWQFVQYFQGSYGFITRFSSSCFRECRLKDNEGRYILNPDATAKWGYTLFGKDIYTSAQMSKMEAGKTAVYYGDMSGLAVKVSENGSIQVLREKFATQHAIGVVAWIEMDGKIENEQKIAVLKMAGTQETTETTGK